LFAADFTCAPVLITEDFRTLLLCIDLAVQRLISSINNCQHKDNSTTDNKRKYPIIRKIEIFSKFNPFKSTIFQAEEIETITIDVVVFLFKDDESFPLS
jgi:hypothetical protein